MEMFSQFVKAVAIFLILQAFVNIIMPANKYKSYMELILGLVLISVMLSPISSILNNITSPLQAIIPKMQLKLDSDISFENGKYVESTQNEMVMKVYENELIKQLSQIIEREGKYTLGDATIVIDKSEKQYGQILSMHIFLKEKKIDKKDRFIRVEKIEVKVPFQDTKNTISQKEMKSEDADNIKKIISNFYNLSLENIYINVYENES